MCLIIYAAAESGELRRMRLLCVLEIASVIIEVATWSLCMREKRGKLLPSTDLMKELWSLGWYSTHGEIAIHKG